MSDPGTEPPVVTVVSGAPTPEELAAIVTILSAAAGGAGHAGDPEARTDRPRVGGWKSYGRTLRRAVQPGPGAWHHFSD